MIIDMVCRSQIMQDLERNVKDGLDSNSNEEGC